MKQKKAFWKLFLKFYKPNDFIIDLCIITLSFNILLDNLPQTNKRKTLVPE